MIDTSLASGWVSSMADYRQMFDLTEKDLKKSIINFPGGISSFNAEMHANGHDVVTGDVIYDFSPEQMQEYAAQALQHNETYLRENTSWLVSNDESFMQEIFTHWENSEGLFLQDYAKGKADKRYQMMTLPELPFETHEFRLALCMDLLFRDSARSGLGAKDVVVELLRIAEEVRVFPLLNEKAEVAEELGPLMLHLQENNYGIEIREVPFQQHKGSNAMLRVWATECDVE